MNIFISLILLGISLSMDAFSLSICIGLLMTKNKAKLLVIIIGFFHFIMPILGALIGLKVNNIISLNSKLIFSVILVILIIQIVLELFSKEEKNYKLSLYELIILSLGVSLDSFTVGFGLAIQNYNIIISSIVFSLASMTFTCLGLIIGKYSYNLLGNYSKLLAVIILMILLIVNNV